MAARKGWVHAFLFLTGRKYEGCRYLTVVYRDRGCAKRAGAVSVYNRIAARKGITRMSKVLSIEIGYSLIKILETDYKAKNPKVYGCINLDTPQGVLNDGELTITEELVTMIKQALSANRMKTKQVIFTITSTKIASREVVLPNVKENKIATLVRANASDYFPVDISQYEIAHIPLGMIGEGTDTAQRKVLVLAAPRAILRGYEELAKACGLSLEGMDYSCNSIYQVVKNECKEGIQMAIKVDERVSIIMILEDGQIVLQRSVPYGVDDAIVTMIESGAYGPLNYRQALELLRRKTCVNRTLHAQTDIAEQDENPTEMMEESEQIHMAKKRITESLENLMRGIARVIDFYNSRNAGKQVQKAYLTGLGGDFSGLSKLLTNELGMHTVVLTKVEGFNLEKNFREVSFGEYVACLGAAIAPLGFMHEEAEEQGGGVRISLFMALSVLVLCIIISIALLMMAYIPYKEAENKNISYRKDIEVMSTAIPSYLEYTATKQAYTYLSGALGETQLETAYLVEFIEELEAKMPHAFFIDSMTVNAESFSMNVTVQSKEEAAECIEQLRTFSCVQSLNVNGVYDARTVDLPNGETFDGALAMDEELLAQYGIAAVENAVVTFSVEGVFSQRFTLDVLQEIIEENLNVNTEGLNMGMLSENMSTATEGATTQSAPAGDSPNEDMESLK